MLCVLIAYIKIQEVGMLLVVCTKSSNSSTSPEHETMLSCSPNNSFTKLHVTNVHYKVICKLIKVFLTETMEQLFCYYYCCCCCYCCCCGEGFACLC